jgi:aryl-alcohol dehydrogenase-like predicted oxidoreductase
MPDGTQQGEVQYRTLGSTGERVSCIGVGGWHLALKHVGEQFAIRVVRTAIDAGINFMDNCWDYNDGESERRMGKALRDGYRDRAFVMTKIDGRSKKEAAKQIDESLRRLAVDYVDLVQHHEVLRYEDPDRIFDPEGAHAALVEARDAGKVRYVGFTGHKDPRIHLYMLEAADRAGMSLDTAQLPLNAMDAHFRSFEKLALPELVRRSG